jgi:hypothetical protein
LYIFETVLHKSQQLQSGNKTVNMYINRQYSKKKLALTYLELQKLELQFSLSKLEESKIDLEFMLFHLENERQRAIISHKRQVLMLEIDLEEKKKLSPFV